jgi:hypothetical protein
MQYSKLLTKIDNWYEKNTKLSKTNNIKNLRQYLKLNEKEKHIIEISSNMKFDYYDFNVNNVRKENIFKVNWRHIVKLFNLYFPKIKTRIYYESHCDVQTEIIRDINCFIHDIYIKIENNDGKVYDCVIEYFEKNSHNDKVDDNKEIITSKFVDLYLVYDERQTYTMYQFMKNTIENLVMLICAASNDCYSLTKINFFKDCQKDIELKKIALYFEYLIDAQKNNKFNFLEFYNNIQPVDSDTGMKLSKDKFIELINKEYQLKCVLDENNYGNYKLLSDIIVYSDDKIESRIMSIYKKIFNRAIYVLFMSQQQIINFIKKWNDEKSNMKEFLEHFCIYQLKNHKNKKHKEKIGSLLFKFYEQTEEYKMKLIK